MSSTRPLPAELLARFPELSPRTTVRLHPTPGIAAVDASKMGGDILWPAEEPWPFCPEHDCVLAPVLQLRKSDVPELGFAQDTDTFQLLWCPIFHRAGGPLPQMIWRARDQVGANAPTPVHPGLFQTDVGEVDAWYLPQPCHLAPERVTELPSLWDLEDATVEAIDEWLLVQLDQWWKAGWVDEPTRELVERFEGHPPPLYGWHFSVAPGTKVGGYVNWIQHSNWPMCGEGHRMEHLLSVMNFECDPGDWFRWVPEDDGTRQTLSVPSGMNDMDADVSAHFICRTCPDRPEHHDFQST